ncbi:endonuclease/exonuclease/phosphatase family protein [Trichuris suis]|nr:endonuclease/exonuclease/phosphatase family protein [Trichuris suis]
MNQGKLEVVKREMKRVNIDILGVSEVHWIGAGEFNSGEHCIYHRGHESGRRNGVALIVSRRIRRAIVGCTLKNDRTLSIRIKGKPFRITVIQVYALTAGRNESEINQFYPNLQRLLVETPRKDATLILGDWNAKVANQNIVGMTGKFGPGVQNQARARLIEFCQENSLTITNTLFQRPKRRLYTWTSPDGQHRNQINYILCSQRWRSCVQSTKTRPGAGCRSDRELLIAKFGLKLKTIRKADRPNRYNLENIPHEYGMEVTNKIKGLRLTNRMPEKPWSEVRRIVQEAAMRITPQGNKSKKATWLSQEALHITEERREAKGRGERERFAQLNAVFQRIARRDQIGFSGRVVEDNNRLNRTRDLYKTIRRMRESFHTKTSKIKYENGRDLTNVEEIKSGWREYFKALYKKDLNAITRHDGTVGDLEPDILESEFIRALRSISNNKAPGHDRIPVELFKILKEDATKVLQSICQQIWKTQQRPFAWTRSIYDPIPKTGDVRECSSYRTVAHISHASKVMLKILQARLQ